MLNFLKEQYALDPKDRIFRLSRGIGRVGLIAHTCHPKQANDGLSGVAVIEHLLNEFPHIYCFEGKSQDSIYHLRVDYCIYLDALGTDNNLKFNRTWKGDTELDKAGKLVFRETYPFSHQGFRNDEMRIEKKGWPCAALHRFPYPEYHMVSDTPDIIQEGKLIEAGRRLRLVIEAVNNNFTPVIKDPTELPMLNPHGLWTDWHINRPMKDIKEQILMLIDGNNSVIDIALACDVSFSVAHKFITQLVEVGICLK